MMNDDQIARAKDFFDSLGAKIDVCRGHDECPPSYVFPGADMIHIKPMEKFPSPECYFSALAHEHVHWSGGFDRLCRPTLIMSPLIQLLYAGEEIVAELGAVMLLEHLGIDTTGHRDHDDYVRFWTRALGIDDDDARKRNECLRLAGNVARRAADYLIELGDENQQKKTESRSPELAMA